MRILYVCDFDLSRSSGKDRATKQKLAALSGYCDSLSIISASSEKKYLRFFESFWIEMKSSIEIIRLRPDYVISRGAVGWFSQFIAHRLNIKTVREVHSDSSGELSLLPYSGASLIAIRLRGMLAKFSDRTASVRIFNHPDLMAWYKKNIKNVSYDFYSYNGYDPSSTSRIERKDALSKFDLPMGFEYLVFIGSASKWHGVEYLVSLQEEFDKNKDKVKIICGGGDVSAYDPQKRCINFSPLNSDDCADLIKAATLCLLPVKSNRVSPGSPLKLYDYIGNKRCVITQINTNGYHDEVLKHGVGYVVDFADPTATRDLVMSKISSAANMNEIDYPVCPVTWADRMEAWIANLSKIQSK